MTYDIYGKRYLCQYGCQKFCQDHSNQTQSCKGVKILSFLLKNQKIAVAQISFVFLRISFVIPGAQEGELPIELEVWIFCGVSHDLV